jgi:LmbE family N-acetylglucosaminyl deacetylase
MLEPVHFLAVRPHPDDESSATGGLLARYHRAGLRTAVITCTGGEEGEIHDPDLVYEDAFPRLAEIRERELRAACEVLGVSELHLLGYRDSGMAGTEANNHPEAFANVDLDQAALRVAQHIRELRPTVIVTENEHGGYGHPDHIMCHRVAVRSWELADDPDAPLDGEPWQAPRLYAVTHRTDGWERIVDLMREANLDTTEMEAMLARRRERVGERPEPIIHAAVDVSDYVEIQREALRCHRTQIPQDSFFLRFPLDIARVAFATAYLQRLQPLPVDGEQDDDLLPA